MRARLILAALLLGGCCLHEPHEYKPRAPDPKDCLMVPENCDGTCTYVDAGPYAHGRYECRK